MERKTFSKAPIYAKNAYTQAGKLEQAGDIQGAIATLLPIVVLCPEVPQLFERLRELEIAKTKKLNPLAKVFCQIASLFVIPIIMIKAIRDPQGAMAMCEPGLARCVDQPLLLNALAFAANRCEAPWVTTTALNALRIFHPANEGNLRKLASAMQQNNQSQDALRIFQMIAKRHPNNLAIQNELREAMAMASIEHGSWEKDASTQDKANDSKDAVLQQLLTGTIHDAEQAQMLIDRFNEMLAENDSVDIRRKLADAYMVKGDFESAYNEYKTVAEKLGVEDPVLDKQIEGAYVSMLQSAIEVLSSNPDAYEDAEGQIAQLTQEVEEYRRRHIFNRAEKFPNDKQLQFDLGEYYYEQGDYDNAMAVFEKVADNPVKRRASLVYIARCLLKTGRPAEAIPHLEEAVSEMLRMDKYKREALYYLGVACQNSGDISRAVECFRSVRASMPNYRDVQERIAALVNENTAQPA